MRTQRVRFFFGLEPAGESQQAVTRPRGKLLRFGLRFLEHLQLRVCEAKEENATTLDLTNGFF